MKYKHIPQEFGEINSYLEQMGCAYPNHKKVRTGLSHALLRLIKQKKIKKLPANKNHKYPRYTSNSKEVFESAFDGYNYRNEIVSVMFKDFAGKSEHHLNMEKYVTGLVNYLGVQMLDTILSSYTVPINPKSSSKSNIKNRDLWLKNALSYHEPNVGILDWFERTIISNSDEYTFENKSVLKDVRIMQESLRNTYPDITKYMDEVKAYLEDVKDALRDTYLNSNQFSNKILD